MNGCGELSRSRVQKSVNHTLFNKRTQIIKYQIVALWLTLKCVNHDCGLLYPRLRYTGRGITRLMLAKVLQA